MLLPMFRLTLSSTVYYSRMATQPKKQISPSSIPSDVKDAQERAEKLRIVIDKHRYLYHVLDKPDITDEAYDSLMEELHIIEEKFPDLQTPDSPTQRIGGEPRTSFKKVTHEMRQWSYDDVFSHDGLFKWEARAKRFIEDHPQPVQGSAAGGLLSQS